MNNECDRDLPSEWIAIPASPVGAVGNRTYGYACRDLEIAQTKFQTLSNDCRLTFAAALGGMVSTSSLHGSGVTGPS